MNILKRVWRYAKLHRIISAVIVVVVAGGGYYWYTRAATGAVVPKYVVAAAYKGSIVQSVSATGQVQAGTTITITPKVSETVDSIPVKIGQHVAQGQLLIQLDSTNEAQSVAQAKLNLESAELSLQELQEISTSTLLSDQQNVVKGQQALVTDSSTLSADYKNGFNIAGKTFVDFQTVMQGLNGFVQGNDLSRTQNDPDAFVSLMPGTLAASMVPYKDSLQSSYQAAVSAYQKNLTDYHAASVNSDRSSLDALFSETETTANTISAAVKAGRDFLTYVIDTYPASSSTKPLPAITATLAGNFATYTDTMTSDVSNMQGVITGISSDQNAIVNDQASLAQASEALAELTGGPTQTQLLSSQISVQNAQNALQTAETNLANTSVRAPLSGTISAIAATIGETAGSNAVTLVGDGEVAEVTLNEIDAAQVQIGQPATLTFDALPDLTLAGQVVEIDPVGTVSQGVVSYNVQIGFSQPATTTSTDLVKPGMSVTANIVTQSSANVIVVPNSAVQTSGATSYVLEPSTPLATSDLAASANGGIELSEVKQVPVTTGISNDTETEITSGVNVGDQIVTQTLKSSNAVSGASGNTNILRSLGGKGGFGGGAAGGAVRIGG